jgi:DNA-binding NtrC family response regulator
MIYVRPGNVHDLLNVIERAIILSKDNNLQMPLFPNESARHEEIKVL